MTRKVAKEMKELTEDQEQIRLANWLDAKGIKFYAIPNGGSRHMLEAIKLKRMGVKAGVPDICIPIPSGNYHGLYLELKRLKGGKLSDTQQSWLSYLISAGFFAECAHGFDEAKRVIEYYLNLTKTAA